MTDGARRALLVDGAVGAGVGGMGFGAGAAAAGAFVFGASAFDAVVAGLAARGDAFGGGRR